MRPIRLPRPNDCRFDEGKAERAVRFFNDHCRHTKGRFYGQPFNLRPFQEIDIREIYGRVDEDGNRIIKQVFKEIPKKNGKSEEAAAHALKLLLADDEPGAEVYSAAADRDQASIVFDVASHMVRLDPALLRAVGGPKGIIDSRKRIVCPSWNSFYRVISAEVGGKHGFNSHGVIFDEVHAQKQTRLWEVLTYGAGAARAQPLTVAITTAGIPGESPVAESLHDDADQILKGIIPCPPDFYPVIYAAPDDADPWDEEVWRYANPALGDFLKIESFREDAAIARRRPTEQNSFRRLHLNQWVQQETRWIPIEEWDQCAGIVDIKELKRLDWYCGIDLSTKRDLTAVVFCCRDGNGVYHLIPYFFIPRDNMRDRPNIETQKYVEWERRGLLTATPGNEVDFQAVRDRVNQIGKELNIAQITYDPLFATQLAQQLTEDGFKLVNFSQTFKFYTEVCNELESAVYERRIRHGGNAMLRWMMDCVAVDQKPDGSIKPVKPDRLKARKRIDGVVASLMAMFGAMRAESNTISSCEVRYVG